MGTIVRGANSLNMITTYKYDYHNAVIKVTDPEGKYINYARDYLGNVTSMSPNGGAAWTYTYDPNGQILTSTSPAGRVVAYDYDGFQRLSSRTFTKNGNPDGQVLYSYDTAPHYGLGRLQMGDSEAGQGTYDYTALGQVKSYTFHSASSGANYTLQYEYSTGGLLKRIVFPDGLAYTYGYYHDGSEYYLNRDDYYYGYILGYSPRLQPGVIGTQTNLYFLQSYTPFGKISRMKSTYGETTITDLNYSYQSGNGRLLTRIDQGPSGERFDFSYDAAGRLSQWKLNQTPAEVYSFASGGSNKTRMFGITGSTANLTFAYGNTTFPWAPTSITDNSAGVTTTYTFDNDGLLTNFKTGLLAGTSLTYDARGLLRDVTPSLFSNTSWKYDHTDTAVWVRSWKGTFPPQDTKSDLVTPAFEAQYSSGLSTKHLFFAGRRFVSIDSTGSVRYYHPDERGSVRYITDAQGNVLETHLYKPYGQEYAQSGSTAFLKYRFNDRRDEGSGLLRWPLRNFKKESYHWTAFDPVARTAPNALVADGSNFFAYCGYDPVNRVDPVGGYGIYGFLRNGIHSEDKPHLGKIRHWAGGVSTEDNKELEQYCDPNEEGCDAGGTITVTATRPGKSGGLGSGEVKAELENDVLLASVRTVMSAIGAAGFILPKSPAELGVEWVRDLSHLHEGGERYRNARTGDYLDWHRARTGKGGNQEGDHWHINKKTNKKHYLAGDKVDLKGEEDSSEEKAGDGGSSALMVGGAILLGAAVIASCMWGGCSLLPVVAF